MKTLLRWIPVMLFAAASTLFGADGTVPVPAPAPTSLPVHARTLGEALLFMLVFAAAGIVIAIVGYKLFDKFTPGDLHKEIVEKQNVAAAVIAAAVVIGICIIIAAAMIG